ncbi:MAG: hypothetical protein EAZ53_03325 [Bacteroidetes bacterium]|nr:MAG: hypothetical protein EAZ53_03325 [Bacteroidota bacterium]
MKNFKYISVLIFISASTFAQQLIHEDSLHLHTFVYQDSTRIKDPFSNPLIIDSIKVDTITFKYSKPIITNSASKFWNVTITSFRTNSVLGVGKLTLENKILTFPKYKQFYTGPINGGVFWDGKYNKVDSCYICSRYTDGSVQGRYKSLLQQINKLKFVGVENKILQTYESNYQSYESNTNDSYKIIYFSGIILYYII